MILAKKTEEANQKTISRVLLTFNIFATVAPKTSQLLNYGSRNGLDKATAEERETNKLTVEQNMSVETTDDTETTYGICDRNNREHTKEAHIFHSDQRTASLPRESVSRSMGDHNSIRNQTQMQNSSQEMSRAMQYMQYKFSNLEHSPQFVTDGVMHRFKQGHQTNNTQALPQTQSSHTRSEVTLRRRTRRRNGCQ